ncbi:MULTISPECIES: energy-coupling factor transporter transmembrane component T [unclassified Lactobacillus]|uniref:energy-coupling factor transporter transmembrane component T n=1 Tax=unclassified Lactobacillus TaxID=2620435 RepID=UPI0018DC9C2F|nr:MULTISPECIES: energy-coupling factor transporter transmembrane component T [unclassified Lactobacillus]MBH9989324.1 energy-coupling factor transporter transmembrane protein EcfT [Lactobacillus sp. M0392]MBI0023935.1 energy-coupling factor transporter transmembrane protein EcfT [Lactobacillus sp. W8171]MBI0044365.1 energy-coupling factor transporter transmembrane protein EcfT [Lactobacillus sp. M0393]
MLKLFKSLYPSTKALIVLLLILLSMMSSKWQVQLCLIAVTMILALFSGTLVRLIKLFFESLALIVVFLFVLQVFFISYPDSHKIWWVIKFSQTGLNTATMLASRIIAISLPIIWYFLVTSSDVIIQALDQTKLPKKAIFVLASTIQVVPQLMWQSNIISEAQQARGVETTGSLWQRIKTFIPMMGPLVLSSVEQNEEKVLTLQARGFSNPTPRTTLHHISKKKIDYLLDIILCLILVVFVIWGGKFL